VVKGSKFYKNQTKRLRRLYRKVARVWHGSYISRRLRRERRVGQGDE
jgi:hypothetical protein